MKNNLIGQQFGLLTVIAQAPSKNNKRYWICQCKCGNQTIVRTSSLTAINGTKSCGCLRKGTKGTKKPTSGNHRTDYQRGRKIIDLSNQRFGSLIALEPTDERKNGSVIWKCKCDCGNICYVPSCSLKIQGTQSCGCIHSFGEQRISKILQENNINFIKEYNIKINNNNRRFDFAIINDNQITRLIEFDGLQHQTDSIIIQRDKEKNLWAKNHNIPLVRIPYNMRDTVTFNDLFYNTKYLVNT